MSLKPGWSNYCPLVFFIQPAEDWYRIAQIKSYHIYDCICLSLFCNALPSTSWRIRRSDTLTWFCRARATLCYYSAIALNFKWILEEYNISHHFSNKHGNYANNQSTQERLASTQRLVASLQAQQNTFILKTAIPESSMKKNYLLAFNLAKTCKPFFVLS